MADVLERAVSATKRRAQEQNSIGHAFLVPASFRAAGSVLEAGDESLQKVAERG
jgi:hypothetical protein